MPRNTSGMPVMSAEDKARQDRYQAEDDLRTLQRAAEVKADEGRMERCMALHEEQKKGMEAIAGKGKREKPNTESGRARH